MTYYWNIISNRPINEIFIPGTHDSVCDENIKIPNDKILQDGLINKINNLKESVTQTVANLKPVTDLTMTQVCILL